MEATHQLYAAIQALKDCDDAAHILAFRLPRLERWKPRNELRQPGQFAVWFQHRVLVHLRLALVPRFRTVLAPSSPQSKELLLFFLSAENCVHAGGVVRRNVDQGWNSLSRSAASPRKPAIVAVAFRTVFLIVVCRVGCGSCHCPPRGHGPKASHHCRAGAVG